MLLNMAIHIGSETLPLGGDMGILNIMFKFMIYYYPMSSVTKVSYRGDDTVARMQCMSFHPYLAIPSLPT